jgi:RHH-type proline utilization regulon transcriptional repressor/proline dehydrogenase/delta 1-pyrroline-5-carboxylate dehydrogenase
MAAAVEAEWRQHRRPLPAVIGGELVRTGSTLCSVDPADPEQVVGEVARCSAADAAAAVEAAAVVAARWAAVPWAERAAVLFRTAEVLRSRRYELAALVVHEVGKPWADADAEVCEAIDGCEHLARQALGLAEGLPVLSVPGERNVLRPVPRGVAAVVAPWNFPLAIPAQLVAAALVAGNAVVFKPAEQAPVSGAELVSAFAAGGLPREVLSFLPGTGEEAGAALVGHPRVDLVAFTGSRAVGLGIARVLAGGEGRRSLPRLVAELGGKNAVIVDSDADLDEVVPAVVSSAFGYAGQKCSAASRLIVVGSRSREIVDRVADAAASLHVAPPRRPESQVGPVIDQDAYDRLRRVAAGAGQVGRVVLDRSEVPGPGWFVGPVVVADVDRASPLARDELFGPVLATFEVPDLEAAVELANEVDDALTAAVFSRHPGHIRQVVDGLRAGVVYVNRGTTGAVVGRQPFGGRGLSGTGRPAGGPTTLLEYCDLETVCENTVRQGFAGSAAIGGAHQPAEPPRGGRHRWEVA